MFGGKLSTTLAAATDAAKAKAVDIAHIGLDYAKIALKKIADNRLLRKGASVAAGAVGGPVIGAVAAGGFMAYNYAAAGDEHRSDDPYLNQDLNDTAKVGCCRDPKVEKKRRRKEREQLIAKGRSSADPKKREAAERLSRDMVAVERARLSKHVYDVNDPDKVPPPDPPTGFLQPTKEELTELGVKPKDLKPPNSDYRAQVYKVDPSVNDVPPEYVVAYRGTVSQGDWQENAKQGVGMESDHYNRAMRLAKTMKKSSKTFAVTGHSLGGGLASAAAVVSGARADTFNAAGLHDKTTLRQGKHLDRERAKQAINAYRVEGADKTELLTSVQKLPLVPDAVGEPRSIPPPREGISRLNLHGIDAVIDGIEQQKTHDQATLAMN